MIHEYYCSFCGTKIEPIDTVDNAGNPTQWNACTQCNRFTSGYSKEVIAIKNKVLEHISTYDKNSYSKTDHICQIIALTLKYKGELDG